MFSWPEVRRGGERYLHEVASALQDAGHDVRILSSARTAGRDRVLGVPTTYFQSRPVWSRKMGECADEFGFGLRAGAHMLARSADVWHALGTSDAVAAATLGRVGRLRSVHTTLGIPSRWYRDTRPDRRLHEFVVREVDDYICLSGAAAAALEAGWGRRGTVLGGGVDLRRFSPGARHPTPVLLYAGTLDDPRKNVALLIEAAGRLRKDVPGLELWISGSGDLNALLDRASAAGREAVVDVGLGTPEDLAALYSRVWATVLPSHDEAFGLVLVESLAAGTPIVVLEDSGGPAEIVQPGVGYAGAPTAEALAEACGQALDLAQQPGTATDCRTEAGRYDWRAGIVPRLEAIYEGRVPV